MMVRKIFILLIVLLVVIAAGVLFKYIFMRGDNTASNSVAVTFPTSSTTVDTTQITTSSQAQVTVKDFIHASTTVQDPYNNKQYILADDCSVNDSCTDSYSSSGFRIVYDTRDNSFNVLLLAEPLRGNRLLSQTFLSNLLGITPANLCSLTHTVGTIQSVNGIYAGQELDFPACPDAVKLP